MSCATCNTLFALWLNPKIESKRAKFYICTFNGRWHLANAEKKESWNSAGFYRESLSSSYQRGRTMKKLLKERKSDVLAFANSINTVNESSHLQWKGSFSFSSPLTSDRILNIWLLLCLSFFYF